MLTLERMLNSGKFDCLMGEPHCIDQNAEVGVVKHGRWEEYWDDAYLTYFYRCSECKADAPSKRDTMLDQLLTPYCQHCGAKMDGGAE